MKKIALLGSGMVGKAMAIDLAKNHLIKLADVNPESLETLRQVKNIQTFTKDCSNAEVIVNFIADCDLVINALPGNMGYQALKTVIGAGKDIVDISFFPEDPFDLDEPAKEKNVTAIMDCGVAPGMSNIILGHHSKTMQIDKYECFVGGLPFERKFPHQYKAPFSPIDVLAEYVRPARFVQNGKLIIKDALTEPEYLDFEEIGTLEAFNTDGLRTLIKTMDIPNMIEKTMRYPGHRELMYSLRETGFFSEEEIEIKGVKISPLEFTARIIFPKWHLEENEREFTVMMVKIAGIENGVQKEYVYRLFDKYDPETETSSMSRTTGYVCTAAANLVLNGDFSRKGLIPPEYLGFDEKCFDFFLKYQEERNIHYREG